MSKILYIVGTPIGNLDDMTTRATKILASVDIVLCEDTRVTRKVLDRICSEAITRPLHQHSTDLEIKKTFNSIYGSVAYVSDAGTPGISDPGGKITEIALQEGFEVVGIPGVSAVTMALSISAFPADKFTFLGFPPHKKGRNKYFEQLSMLDHTVALYESKHRILKTLDELPQDRPITVGRELTKIHEITYRGLPAEVKNQVEESSAKGEFVIVVAPKKWKA